MKTNVRHNGDGVSINTKIYSHSENDDRFMSKFLYSAESA